MKEEILKIARVLNKSKQTLCLAESCTGGLVSSMITDLPKSSQFFVGSLVSYSNEIKHQFFHVPSSILKHKGAVNKETALFMAKGVKSLLKGDWSLSITGLMGPDGYSSEQTPKQVLGQIFVGVYGPQSHFVLGTIISGRDRQERKYKTACFCLNFLLSKLH